MSLGLNQAIPFRDMWIMTLPTVQTLSGLAQVNGHEVLVICLVTFETDTGHPGNQERNLLAPMRVVAVQTFAIGCGRVGVARLHSQLQIFVAQIT